MPRPYLFQQAQGDFAVWAMTVMSVSTWNHFTKFSVVFMMEPLRKGMAFDRSAG